MTELCDRPGPRSDAWRYACTLPLGHDEAELHHCGPIWWKTPTGPRPDECEALSNRRGPRGRPLEPGSNDQGSGGAA